MESINKVMEINEHLWYKDELYSRMNEFNSENDKQKIVWYDDREMGWNTIKDKERHKELETCYNAEFLKGIHTSMKHKKTLVDVEEFVEFKGVTYMRFYSNWPSERTYWLTRDGDYEKIFKEELKQEGIEKINFSCWNDCFKDSDLPIKLEELYSKKYLNQSNTN